MVGQAHRLWCCHNLTTLLAGPKLLIVEEASIDLRNRVVSIVLDNKRFLMKKAVTLFAISMETVDFAIASLAF